jgi:type II secretory pathway pseudopilin PulG
LVEIMVVVVIIGLLAAIAVPAISRTKENAGKKRFISDLRTLAQAFETYAMKNGCWPPDSNRGVVPPSMSGEFRDEFWTTRNSLGGLWDWDYKQFGYTAGISTVEVTLGDEYMAGIDAMIDDGDLTKGTFVKINADRYMYVLQK